MDSLVPRDLNRDCQKALVNFESLSDNLLRHTIKPHNMIYEEVAQLSWVVLGWSPSSETVFAQVSRAERAQDRFLEPPGFSGDDGASRCYLLEWKSDYLVQPLRRLTGLRHPYQCVQGLQSLH